MLEVYSEVLIINLKNLYIRKLIQIKAMFLQVSTLSTINKYSYKSQLSSFTIAFNRFLWLRPLSSVTSESVLNHLQEIFCEHGPPKTILTDNGTEFKGAVQKLCSMMGVRMQHGRPRHPQTTGKVRILSRMIMI